MTDIYVIASTPEHRVKIKELDIVADYSRTRMDKRSGEPRSILHIKEIRATVELLGGKTSIMFLTTEDMKKDDV